MVAVMRYPSFCKINLETVFKIIILLGYCFLFAVMVLTNKISDYLHPRLIPFVIFAAIAFLLMTYSLLLDFKRKSRRFSVAPYLVFLIPLILAFAVPAKAINNSNLQFSNTKITGLTSGQSIVSGNTGNALPAPTSTDGGSTLQSNSAQSQITDNSGVSDTNQAQSLKADDNSLHLQPNQKAVYTKSLFGSTITLIITDNTITVDDKNFISWMSELNNNPDNYNGMKIEYVGYVYKSSDFKSNQFVAGRDMMWCCAADIQLAGCLCQYDKTSELKANSWVKVDGTLSTTTWQGAATPLIEITSITPAQKPADDYVYASY